MGDDKQHGGKRKGAGRPPLGDEATVPKRLTAPPSYWERLKRIGEGNMSEGLRKLIRWYDETH